MEFKTNAQKECYERVKPMIKELFGEMALFREDAPMFGIIVGSALTETVVLPWGEDDALVSTRSYVVTDVDATPDLMRFLLTENSKFIFGAFGLDDDGDIIMENSLYGKTCDKEELRNSILAVAKTADTYDDKIVSRWGGQRAEDRLSQ